MKKELQIKESLLRIKMFDIYKQAITVFEKESVVNKSEYCGILFWFDENEQEMVKNFE